MDVINLTNLTFINAEMQAVVSQVNTLVILFKALGGVFILWVVMYFLNRRAAKKQRQMTEELRRDIKKLVKEIKESKKLNK